MSGAVKPPTGRTAQARATRRRIVDAAAELFVASGYGNTTLEQIAERAGVAVQTVYFHFRNKRTVLKEAVDIAAVGDDEPVALLDRPWIEQVVAEPDSRRSIALWVRSGREIYARIAPIMSVVRDAAVVDPDMAAQWATNQEQRATAMRVLVQLFADRGALKPGMSVDEATDIVLALNSIEVYLILAARGWSGERWERWMAGTLADALLA
ncbi:TetR/AcrR family transcriptional regulator [Pseudonocardia sp. GCM10023141]|uniref:TetR/AcrR family transcriptional regulator n=1 Tax=Pseudonocardia sp. GCM10023141 TaxID=3252653 RepID=UPI003614B5F9